ncbi:MAG TPA: site-2 protease family protein [Bacteroidota bacterium]|nr:site-2 protease family protein [Bacteroidota bacterium]
MDKVAEGLLWYVAFLFSTTLHEASHAFAAFRLGDRTAYEGGQLTLDPIPHIRREPLGTVVIPIVSFLLGGWMIGWASVPYDPRWAYENPRSAAKMSAAGPLSNLLLAVGAALAIRIGMKLGVFLPPDSINYSHVIDATESGVLGTVAAFVNVFFSLNLLLFIFNLLPIPPLDGSGMVPLFLNKDRAQRYFHLVHNQGFAFLGIIVAWNLFDWIYSPLHLFFINVLFFPEAHYH